MLSRQSLMTTNAMSKTQVTLRFSLIRKYATIPPEINEMIIENGIFRRGLRNIDRPKANVATIAASAIGRGVITTDSADALIR